MFTSVFNLLMQRESDVAFARADELQKQRDELHGDHERLRKEYMQDLQKKVHCSHIGIMLCM